MVAQRSFFWIKTLLICSSWCVVWTSVHQTKNKMAEIETTKRFELEGELLRNLRFEMRQMLEVDQTLDHQGCIVCAPYTRTSKKAVDVQWYSPAGQKEYRTTGVCEPCFDKLLLGNQKGKATKLTPAGMVIVRLWLALSRTTERLSMEKPLAQNILSILLGETPWPAVWNNI